jgi:hypothetical protein
MLKGPKAGFYRISVNVPFNKYSFFPDESPPRIAANSVRVLSGGTRRYKEIQIVLLTFNASLNPLPNKLNARTKSIIAKPGASASIGFCVMMKL